MKRVILAAVAAALIPSAVFAQSEAALKQALEGRTMVLRINMPGSQEGVDIYPERSQPLDYRMLAERLKINGTGIALGQSEVITLIKIKGNHIEVQLGGGGFGTFADRLRTANTIGTTNATYQGKTQRERDLEERLRYTNDREERRRLQRQLDEERNRRTRDNMNAQADARAANALSKQAEQQERGQGGSRFNVRFDGSAGVPAQFLTPDALLDALAKYATPADAPEAFERHDTTASGSGPSKGMLALKKGLTLAEVEKALGPASGIANKSADGMEMQERTYNVGDRMVVCRMVSGVLVDYLIKAR